MIGPPPTLEQPHGPFECARDSSRECDSCDFEAITLRLDAICEGLTPSQIAATIGLPRPSAIQRYLSGFAPSVEFIVRLCHSFDVPADWVLFGRGSSDPHQYCRCLLERVETEALVDELHRRLVVAGEPRAFES